MSRRAAVTQSNYPKRSDYTDKATGIFNLTAYENALIERGYQCYVCRSTIIFPEKNGRCKCSVCESAPNREGEWDSERVVRCPSCYLLCDPKPALPIGEEQKLGDFDLCLQCSCGCVFTVKCQLQYTFTSPPLLNKGAGDEEETKPATEEETENTGISQESNAGLPVQETGQSLQEMPEGLHTV